MPSLEKRAPSLLVHTETRSAGPVKRTITRRATATAASLDAAGARDRPDEPQRVRPITGIAARCDRCTTSVVGSAVRATRTSLGFDRHDAFVNRRSPGSAGQTRPQVSRMARSAPVVRYLDRVRCARRLAAPPKGRTLSIFMMIFGALTIAGCSSLKDVELVNPCSEGIVVNLWETPTPRAETSDLPTQVVVPALQKVESKGALADVGNDGSSAEIISGPGVGEVLFIPHGGDLVVIVPARLCHESA